MPLTPGAVDACMYLRLSLDRTGEMLGVDRQRDAALDICARQGWTAREYVDNSVSASKARGPDSAYGRIMADARAGRVKVVIVWDLDRLTRSPREIEDWIDLCEQHGVRLVTMDGECDTRTENGRLFLRIKAAVARHEVEHKAARQRAAHAQKAAKGLPAGGRRPFAYCQHGPRNPVCPDLASCPGPMLSVIPEEADALRRAAETVITGGKGGLWKAVADLNATGLKAAGGGEWHHTELRRVLLNARYAGRRMHNGVDTGPGQWPAILDEVTAAAVRAILQDPGRRRTGRPASYLLSSIARCGQCGDVIHASPTPKYPIYTCASRRHVSVRMSWVDARVVGAVAWRAVQPDFLELFVQPTDRDQLAGLRSQESVLIARKNALAQAFAAEIIDLEQLAAGTRQLNAELAEVTRGMSTVVTAPMFAELLGVEDVEGTVRGWYDTDLPRLRDLVASVARWELWSPGRGARSLPDTAVRVEWRTY